MDRISQNLELLNFREATQSDIASIVSIHNSHVRTHLKSLSQGFLLAEIDRHSVMDDFARSKQYFVATRSESENDLLGFVCLSKPKISTDSLKQIRWIDPRSRDKLQDPRHLFIHVVATQRQSIGQGVGQFMYRSLYRRFPDSFFSLFIVVKPIYNQRSMRFHLKQNFKKVATLRVERFLDLRNYQDALMLKEP